ncbi:MAG TPA: hypothetical protein VFS30_11625 [Dehalococcoidia bacterium]|nr:hypothetical protein [Dehalococcoidia bacterium]
MADATLFEKRGVPTACVITHQFTRAGNAMARRNGYPDYKYAMVPHPIGNLKPEQIKQRALEVLPQVIEILGLE